MRKDLVFGVALLLAAAAAAQGEARPLVWRDFTAVQRLRVVCSNKHFGRLDDLLVAVPGGQITAAVVTMPQAQGPRRVVVPFAELQLDSGANLLQLAACTEEGHVYAAFDPESLGVTARVGDDKRIVLRVETITPPEAHEVSFAGDLAENIASGYADDLLTQYVQAIEKQSEITYNQQMLNQALGISAQEN